CDTYSIRRAEVILNLNYEIKFTGNADTIQIETFYVCTRSTPVKTHLCSKNRNYGWSRRQGSAWSNNATCIRIRVSGSELITGSSKSYCLDSQDWMRIVVYCRQSEINCIPCIYSSLVAALRSA